MCQANIPQNSPQPRSEILRISSALLEVVKQAEQALLGLKDLLNQSGTPPSAVPANPPTSGPGNSLPSSLPANPPKRSLPSQTRSADEFSTKSLMPKKDISTRSLPEQQTYTEQDYRDYLECLEAKANYLDCLIRKSFSKGPVVLQSWICERCGTPNVYADPLKYVSEVNVCGACKQRTASAVPRYFEEAERQANE